jgi:5-methylcytosine-specific restriction endonuclease McrA
MRAQNGLCTPCGHRFAAVGELSDELQIEYAATFDHVIPRSQGGEDELSNFRLVHFRCNVARGDGNGSNRAASIPRVLR